jgi:hypothetical protein
MIQFHCSCGKLLRAKPELVGRRIKCPHCQATQVVPGSDEEHPACISAEDAELQIIGSYQEVTLMRILHPTSLPSSLEPSAGAAALGFLETAKGSTSYRYALLSAARARRLPSHPRPSRRSGRGLGSFLSRLAAWACLTSLLFVPSLWGVRNPNASSSVSPSVKEHVSSFKPIESLRVGDRVITNDLHGTKSAPTAVDPRTWRLVKMRTWERWADGTWDDINIETLQPPEWLAAHKVQVGAKVPIPLDLVEMGMSEHLQGEVLAVEPCPAIKPGRGRVILTTINHLNRYVLELTVEDGRGNQEKIRPTGFHKFFRATDGKWVSAEDLRSGDQLCGDKRTLRVVSNSRFPGVHRVYNMTVEAEHVYRVSSLGVLTHNNGCFEVEVTPGKGIKKGPPISVPDAVDQVRMGGDILAPSKSVAQSIAAQAGQSPPKWEPPHGPRQMPHYHPQPRTGGHVFYDE